MTAPLGDIQVANQHYFNELSRNYVVSSSATELARRTATAILKSYDFDEESTSVVDFACGAGLLSQQLAPHVKSIVGVDISQGMVDLYNQFVSNQGIPQEEMRAICIERIETLLLDETFDVVVCASSYHHLPSIDDTTRALASFLKPNGVLLVVDLMKSDTLDLDEIFPEHAHQIVAHRGGFTRNEMEKAFSNGGLRSFTFEPMINVKKSGRAFHLFVAKGNKSDNC